MDAATARALAISVRSLHVLLPWHPVAELAMGIAEGIAGDSLARTDLLRLASWARQWGQTAPGLREFYMVALGHAPQGSQSYPAVSAGLWNLFEGHPVAGAQLGGLYRLYRDLMGTTPPFPLTRGRS